MKIVREARTVLESGDAAKLGRLMDENQRLLKEMNLSCKEAEEIIEHARKAGATGAKITGTGRGGYVVLLTKGKDAQEKVAKAIEAAGYRVMKTEIGI